MTTLDITRIAELVFGVRDVTMNSYTPNETSQFETNILGCVGIKEIQDEETGETSWYVIRTTVDSSGDSETDFVPGCSVDTDDGCYEFTDRPDELGVAEELTKRIYEHVLYDIMHEFRASSEARLQALRCAG